MGASKRGRSETSFGVFIVIWAFLKIINLTARTCMNDKDFRFKFTLQKIIYLLDYFNIIIIEVFYHQQEISLIYIHIYIYIGVS